VLETYIALLYDRGENLKNYFYILFINLFKIVVMGCLLFFEEACRFCVTEAC
jgi:hypothetical protein